MKTLLVLRHGKSAWDDPTLADHDRPLKNRGLRGARRIGELLAARSMVPDLVLSSSARRARQTAAEVMAAAGPRARQTATRELYGSGVAGHLAVLSSHASEADATVMIVGHNPDLEALVDRLTGERVRLKTAFLAIIDLPAESWDLGTAHGSLRRILEPERD